MTQSILKKGTGFKKDAVSLTMLLHLKNAISNNEFMFMYSDSTPEGICCFSECVISTIQAANKYRQKIDDMKHEQE